MVQTVGGDATLTECCSSFHGISSILKLEAPMIFDNRSRESADSKDSEVVWRPRRSRNMPALFRDSDVSDSDDGVICAICKRRAPEGVKEGVGIWR